MIRVDYHKSNEMHPRAEFCGDDCVSLIQLNGHLLKLLTVLFQEWIMNVQVNSITWLLCFVKFSGYCKVICMFYYGRLMLYYVDRVSRWFGNEKFLKF